MSPIRIRDCRIPVVAIVAGCFALSGAVAQDGASPDTLEIEIRTSSPPDTLALGTLFELSLSLVHGGLEGIELLTTESGLEPFELAGWRRELDRGDTATVVLALRPFRVGDLKLPPLVLTARDPDGSFCVAMTDSLAVVVASIVPDDATQILDIHEAVPIRPGRRIWPYLVGALLLGGAVVAFLLWRRRRRDEDLRGTTAKPAHESALLAIAGLSGSELARSGPWKTFYTELTDILRGYLVRRYGIEAPDLTTVETMRAMGALEIPSTATTAIREILDEADAVKFARAQPDSPQPGRHLKCAAEFVRSTTPVPAASAEGGGS